MLISGTGNILNDTYHKCMPDYNRRVPPKIEHAFPISRLGNGGTTAMIRRPETADIKLYLVGPNGEDSERNPVYLHSQVLRKSEFYNTMLSDRWSCSDERPLEIKVTSSHPYNRVLTQLHK